MNLLQTRNQVHDKKSDLRIFNLLSKSKCNTAQRDAIRFWGVRWDQSNLDVEGHTLPRAYSSNKREVNPSLRQSNQIDVGGVD
jgi:hypothetical protein